MPIPEHWLIHNDERRIYTPRNECIKDTKKAEDLLDRLPIDIWSEILSRCETLHDLHNAILTRRCIVNAFNATRRSVLIPVARAELSNLMPMYILHRLKWIIERLGPAHLDEAVATCENTKPWQVIYSQHYVVLSRLYSKQGRVAQSKQRLLLESVYERILADDIPNFSMDLDAPLEGTIYVRPHSLGDAQDELMTRYAKQCTGRERLTVEQEAFRRWRLISTQSKDWGMKMLATAHALQTDAQSNEYAVRLLKHIIKLCEQGYGRTWDAMLFWMQALIDEHTRAGQHAQAIQEQKKLLAKWPTYQPEYAACARQLIAMQKRAHLFEDALQTTIEMWTSLRCEPIEWRQFGRELAQQYRRMEREAEAMSVLQEMGE